MHGTDLREVLEDVAGRVAVRPPTRAELDRRLRGVRRRRRLTRAVQVVAVAAVAIGTVQLAPLPGGPPAVTLPATGASVLAQQPTKGPLKDDAQFLAALRTEVAADHGLTADRVDVLYAGDLGEYRLAAVETSPPGASGERRQIWLRAPRGAAGNVMRESSSSAVREVAPDAFGPGDVPGATSWSAVVLASKAVDVVVVGPVRVDREGIVTWPRRPLEAVEPGLYEVVLPAGTPRTFLQIDSGFPFHIAEPQLAPRSEAEVEALRAGALPAVRAGAPNDLRLERALVAAQDASGLPAATSQRRLVFSGEFAGVPVDVVEVRSADGGRVMSALVGVGDVLNGQATAAAVATSGADGEPAMAWLFGEGGSNPVPGRTRVGLVGPPDAVLARLTAADGTTTDVPLAQGVGAGGGPEAESVTFLDARGSTVAGVRVTQPGDAAALYPPEFG